MPILGITRIVAMPTPGDTRIEKSVTSGEATSDECCDSLCHKWRVLW
jgi:hypothetical protein